MIAKLKEREREQKLLKKLYKFQDLFIIFVYVCVYVRVCAYECRYHRTQKDGFGSLELQLQVVVS